MRDALPCDSYTDRRPRARSFGGGEAFVPRLEKKSVALEKNTMGLKKYQLLAKNTICLNKYHLLEENTTAA